MEIQEYEQKECLSSQLSHWAKAQSCRTGSRRRTVFFSKAFGVGVERAYRLFCQSQWCQPIRDTCMWKCFSQSQWEVAKMTSGRDKRKYLQQILRIQQICHFVTLFELSERFSGSTHEPWSWEMTSLHAITHLSCNNTIHQVFQVDITTTKYCIKTFRITREINQLMILLETWAGGDYRDISEAYFPLNVLSHVDTNHYWLITNHQSQLTVHYLLITIE